jgi:hypothetical protein
MGLVIVCPPGSVCSVYSVYIVNGVYWGRAEQQQREQQQQQGQ